MTTYNLVNGIKRQTELSFFADYCIGKYLGLTVVSRVISLLLAAVGTVLGQ